MLRDLSIRRALCAGTSRRRASLALLVAALSAGTLSNVTATASASGVALYASPHGKGALCLAVHPCSLEAARTRVRWLAPFMTRDIEVRLAGGTYRLKRPFVLDGRDSGRNGHMVVYRAASPGHHPVLSGGLDVTGWKDAGGGLWKARVPKGTRSRQLYVNGVRAQRARDERPFTALGVTRMQINADRTGYNVTNISADGNAIQNWRNPGDVEFVYVGTTSSVPAAKWAEPRCGVAAATRDEIAMRPCFKVAMTRVFGGLAQPTYVENAFELMDEPGEWYLDTPGRTLYYRPRAGESMRSASVVLPVLETILEGRAVENLRLERLTFAYATWLTPSSDTGFPEGQANLYFPDADAFPVWAPGNVAFSGARNVEFERNTLIHLGGQGLSFDGGSYGNKIARSTFTDISGNGVRVGELFAENADNTVADNTVEEVAVEFRGGVGIATGRVAGTTIEHNEVSGLPYTGISVGFGTGTVRTGGNVIAGNDVHHVMRVLGDGGGIYVNGSQPDSKMFGNWIHDDESDPLHSSSAMYLDNGSVRWDVYSNVASETATSRWLNVQSRVTPFATANTIHHNFSDTLRMLPCLEGHPCEFPAGVPDRGNTYDSNAFILDGLWPPGARAIMEAAGVRD